MDEKFNNSFISTIELSKETEINFDTNNEDNRYSLKIDFKDEDLIVRNLTELELVTAIRGELIRLEM